RTDLNPDAAMQSAVEDAAPPPPKSGRPAVNGSIIAGVGLVALIALWIFAVRVLRVPPYILPAPEAVLNALWSGLAVNPASPKGLYLPLWSTLSNAAPFIFAGLDMAVVYALLGAIVAEFLGAQQGMGVVITQAQAVSDVAGVFAALVILGVLGIALHSSVRRLEHRVVHWAHRGKR